MKTSPLNLIVGAIIAVSGSAASAEILPDFKIDERAITGVPGSCTDANCIFTADKLTGPYVEQFRTTGFNAGTGVYSFETQAYFTIQGFSANNAATPLTPVYFNASPVLAGTAGYGLWGTFVSKGTFTISGGKIDFFGSTGEFDLFADLDQNTVKSFVGLTGVLSITGDSDDKLLISSNSLLSGEGHVATTGSAKGDFALLFDKLGLSGMGQNYFFDPKPFYLQARATGQLDSFTPPAVLGEAAVLDGSVDIRFVPEPASLALVGASLLALGAIRRRKPH